MASVNATEHQLYKLDKSIDKFIPAFPHLKADELQKLRTYAMLEDTFGTLWLGTWTEGFIQYS